MAAATSTVLLAAGLGLSAGGTILGTIGRARAFERQAGALREQADFRKQNYEFNAKIAGIQARDSIRRGGKEAARVRRLGKQTIGAQRAALAAQGIEVDTGTALLVQEETAVLAEQEAMTVKNNAFRQAFGFKVEAFNLREQARMTELAAEAGIESAFTQRDLTILGGITQLGSTIASAGFQFGGGDGGGGGNGGGLSSVARLRRTTARSSFGGRRRA